LGEEISSLRSLLLDHADDKVALRLSLFIIEAKEVYHEGPAVSMGLDPGTPEL